MNKSVPPKLTVLQYIFLIHGTQVGIGVLSMPRELAEAAGTDGWISLLIGWGAAVIASLLIISVMKRYPNHTIVELLPLFLGKWVGRAAIVLIILYCLLACITVIGNTVGILNIWILTQTPGYLIVFLFVIPTYVILQKGIHVLGRYSELIFYLTLWMPVVLTITLSDAHWLNLLPVVKEGWGPIISGARLTVYSFLGFELAFFAYPFLHNKKYAALGIVAANTWSLLVFLHVTILCFTYFSPDEITKYTWPTLVLLKGIEYRFLERVDITFLSFYLLVLSTTIFPYVYFTIFSSSHLLKKWDPRKQLKVFLILLVAAFWLYTPTFMDLRRLTELWSQAGLVFGYAVPLLISGPIWLYHRSAKGRKI
ncbi:GerAB/ArcD/ProY family transporter [Brevibacillus panacihumi]|uniref:GerAB/ArcD/ProY family transporter n=1 Tax=Brevibacillus panacihumi TaxID=497735 RepID=UPI003D079E32